VIKVVLCLIIGLLFISTAHADTCPTGWTGLGTCQLPSTAGVVTLAAQSPVPVTAAGALADGASHPACTTLGLANLAALQAYTINGFTFSAATACTNELDWIAIQTIINAGKSVSFPAGTYIIDNANSASDGSGTITLPPANDQSPGSGSVSLFGVASASTILSWPADLGTGYAGLVCNQRSTSTCAGVINDLFIKGPATTGYTANLGAQMANMDGFYWGGRRQVTDLGITGFNKCFDVVGDQTAIYQLTTINCTYGVYFDTPSTTNFGNITFYRAILDGSSRAAVGVKHGATISEDTWVAPCFCAAPWGILMEMGGATDHPDINVGSVYINPQFENLGNGAIGDDSNTSPYYAIDYNTKYINPEFLWAPANKNPSQAANAVFNLYQTILDTIDGINLPTSWTPGALGIFDIEFPTEMEVTGDVATLQSNATTAGKPFSVYNVSANQFMIREFGQRSQDVGNNTFNPQYTPFISSPLPSGTPSTYACFTSGGQIVSSATAC
jgi:hypothetical protein